MNPRQNLIAIYKKQGYEYAPVHLELCPAQIKVYEQQIETDAESFERYFDFPEIYVDDLSLPQTDKKLHTKYFDSDLNDIRIDSWGVGYEKGSEACAHMEHFLHPMESFSLINEFKKYPYPDYFNADISNISTQVKQIQRKGYIAKAMMACTLWEIAWYMRGMEQLMTDMILNPELAKYHLDRVTEISIHRAREFAKAGVDIILTGDDVGMQNSLMMSEKMYCDWIKPRFAKIIAAAKDENPDVLIEYHSCGYVEPLIPHFIECGIDILNPVQPECMDFKSIYKKYGDIISFKGTIGTQTTMPFGTTDDVRNAVKNNLEIAGPSGGLFCCPTHMIEPEVPWENIMAYIEACAQYKP